MPRLLHCPHCLAEFPFADWQRAATCPRCERRLSFFEASGQVAPSDDVAPAEGVGGADEAAQAEAARAARAAAIAQAPIVALPTIVNMTARAATMSVPAPGTHPAGVNTFFGKPLAWSRGWTIVLVVWLLAAAGLTVIRLEMGHLTALDGRERAAITTVEHGELEPGVSYSHALDLLASRVDPLAVLTSARSTARWYVFDRSWENRLYVYWQIPGYQPLSWTVQGDTASADGETALILKAAVRGSAEQTASPAPTL